MSEFQVGAISPGPYQPALYGASAHGGRTRRCGPGTAPLVPPERCVAPRRPPATPGDPRPVRCCGRSSGHCRTGALRHHPRPSRQPRLPAASFSYFRPPSPSFLVVCFFFPTFFVFHQPPLTPASRGALWGTPGHRRPPRPASASGHLHKAHPSPQPPVSPPRAEPTPPAHPAARPRCSLGAGASPRRGGRRAPARGGPRQRPPSGTPRREASAGAAPPRAR